MLLVDKAVVAIEQNRSVLEKLITKFEQSGRVEEGWIGQAIP